MSDGNPFIASFDEHADWGVDYGRTFTYLDEDGVAISLSGKTGHLKVRLDYSTDALLSLTATGNVDGTISFSATGTAMRFQAEAQYTEFSFVYDVVLFDGSDPVLKLVRGSFTVHPTAAV